MSNFHNAYLRAVDDLNAGREHPIETYLELVPDSEQDALASMISELLVARGPAAVEVDPTSETYAAALAVVDDVMGSAGPSGILPGALRTMRIARRLDPDDVVEHLAQDFGISGAEGRRELERFYHRLESGLLIGPRIAHRLLHSLSQYFPVAFADLVAAARSMASPASSPEAALGLGRPASGDAPPPSSKESQLIGTDPEVELVRQLFTGGPDV